MRKASSFLIFLLAGPAYAVQLTCAIDAVTDKHYCFPPSQLKIDGNIRRAPLYSGGPLSLDATGFTVSVNCTTKAIELRDRQSVVFARNYSTTQIGRDLADYLCYASPPKKKR